MKKSVLIFLVMFSLLMIMSVATSILPPSIKINCELMDLTCLNEDCTEYIDDHNQVIQNISDDYYRLARLGDNIVYIDTQIQHIYYPTYTHQNKTYKAGQTYELLTIDENISKKIINVVDKICVEDIKALQDEIGAWSYAWGYMGIEPYTAEKENELVEYNSKLTSCHYYQYSKKENWLVISNKKRDYCYQEDTLAFSLTTTRLNRSKFISHIKDLKTQGLIAQSEYNKYAVQASLVAIKDFNTRFFYLPILIVLVVIVLITIYFVDKKKS